MADGQQTSRARPGLRPAVPHLDGPIASSGAAPEHTEHTEHTEAPPATTADLPTGSVTDVDRPPTENNKPAPAETGTGTVPAARGRLLLWSVHAARAVGRFIAARGRATVAWAHAPKGRLILPAVVAGALVGGAATAGAYLVPQSLSAPAATAPTTTQPVSPATPLPSTPVFSAPIGSSAPVAAGAAAPSAQASTGGRPADALAGWAERVGTRVGIPVVAAQAYGYTELVLRHTAPGCHLSWTTIAALAKVESAHGSANGAVLGTDGVALPPIIGLPLDGRGGRQLIKDTDQGALDGDSTYDRAVGPMQFIPATWRTTAVDADNTGIIDPNDIDDAALTAGIYLCRNGRNLAAPADWWEAILSYNAVQPYAQKVFAEANSYGIRSRG